MVPMRDGVNLSTDLYFPEGLSGRLPVILIRTPYDKTAKWVTPSADMFAEQGYVVALQDVRSRFESEGQNFLENSAEPEDGYDAVNWLAAQPWSSGKIGTYGCSYLGEAQYEQAKLRNQHLLAMIPQNAGPLRYHNFGITTGGALELAGSLRWHIENASKIHPRLPTDVPRSEFVQAAKYFDLNPIVPKVDYSSLFKSLPLLDMTDRVGAPPSHWQDIVSHESGDLWWEHLGYIKDTDRFDVPALHVTSWYDLGAAQTIELFQLLRTNAESTRGRDNQFIIISPTTHCKSEQVTDHTIVGQREVGDAQFDFYGLYLRWFDHWLKETDNGVTKIPHVQYYVMGKDEWRSAEEWPLPHTVFTNYYLHSGGQANSRFGDGTMSPKPPDRELSDHYTYDPMTPVPSVGGPQCCTGKEAPAGSYDQSEVEARNDMLVYTTPVLEQGIEVTGPIRAVLYVSSSARDTDFTAKLVDVCPDGTGYNVQEGILRARYREGLDRKVWMNPDGVYKVEVDLEVTSNYFGSGHRIRLEISSSNFPRFDRNLNTGGNNYDETKWVVAKSTIHHSKQYPSHVVLPIIP